MSEVFDKYQLLHELARRGNRTFTVDEVLSPGDPGVPYDASAELMSGVFGTGLDLTRPVQVLDVVEGAFVDGTFDARFVSAASGRLLVRVRLSWTTSAGDDHDSYARYQITPEEALNLDAGQPAEEDKEKEARVAGVLQSEFPGMPEDIAGGLADGLFGGYQITDSEWQNQLPGWRHGAPEDMDADTANAHSAYHSRAVREFVDRVPEATMLSDMDLGQVLPQEVVIVADWLAAQP